MNATPTNHAIANEQKAVCRRCGCELLPGDIPEQQICTPCAADLEGYGEEDLRDQDEE